MNQVIYLLLTMEIIVFVESQPLIFLFLHFLQIVGEKLVILMNSATRSLVALMDYVLTSKETLLLPIARTIELEK